MRSRILISLAAAAGLGAGSLMAHDDDRGRDRDGRFRVFAKLTGYEENQPVSTTGKGIFSATVDTRNNTITWRLKYEDLEGGDTLQAHVHFGQLSVNGGVSFFLCSNLGNGPAGTQPCTNVSGDLTGVITPELVVGPAGQGIEASSFAEIAAAMRNGTAYANVHSTRWPGGEIRGQMHD
jgi:hypothetical protein